MATIYSVTVCDADDTSEPKIPEKLCTFHCSTSEPGKLNCKIYEGNSLGQYNILEKIHVNYFVVLVSEGEDVKADPLYTFDLTNETDYARLGENAVIIDLLNLNIIVKFQCINGNDIKIVVKTLN